MAIFREFIFNELKLHRIEAVCLPYNMPSLKLLLKNGWTPSIADKLWGFREKEFKKSGIIEVHDCSGTGFARCFFSYNGNIASLQVITKGEVDSQSTGRGQQPAHKTILNLITNQGGILHLGDAVVYKNHNISPACTKLPGGAQFCSEKPNSATYRNYS